MNKLTYWIQNYQAIAFFKFTYPISWPLTFFYFYARHRDLSESPIRPLNTEENQHIFFESVFIGKTLQLKMNPNGMPTMKWTGEVGTYHFVATNV